MSDLIYRSPEQDVVELRLDYAPDVAIRNWTQYQFNSNYETPTDGWSFTIGDDELPARMAEQLHPGAALKLSINGLVQGSGYIDKIRRHISRGGGTETEISGRDRFGPVVDAHIDPHTQFKKDMTVEQLVRTVFADFGFDSFSFDSDADHKVKTGRARTRPNTTAKSRSKKKLDQLRPEQHEGAFAFAARIAQREGLWIQPSADGTTVICDQPRYDQPFTHTLFRGPLGSNILDGTVEFNITDQPSIIIADGSSGGGEFGHSKTVAKMVNPFTGVDQNGVMWPEVKLVSDRYKEAVEYFFGGITFGQRQLRWPRQYHIRPIFLHDESSSNQEQLERFIRREMSLRARKALTVTYTVEGHGQYTPEGEFVPYAVDTLINVKDEPAGLDTNLWVLSRTFEKSRMSGTTTRLELIVPGSLEFGGK